MSDATERGAVPHEDTFGLSGDLAAALAPAPEAGGTPTREARGGPPAPPSATSDASAASVLAPAVVHTSKDDANDDAAYGLDSEIPVSPARAPFPPRSRVPPAARRRLPREQPPRPPRPRTMTSRVPPRVPSPPRTREAPASGSKWVSAQASVRMMTFIERVGKMAAHARPRNSASSPSTPRTPTPPRSSPASPPTARR